MLFAALSCLQGRGQWEVAQELLQLPIDGLQLTPGNKPDWPIAALKRLEYIPGQYPERWVPNTADGQPAIRVNRHEGHDFNCMVRPVYRNGQVVWWQGSIHAHSNWREAGLRTTVETMYPNKRYDYGLMTTDEYDEAIALETPVALDLSHADICINQGLLTTLAVRRMLDNGNVQELHVSYNNGRNDTHSPFPKSYGWLPSVEAWAQRYPMRPVVVECYLHKLNTQERLRQFEMFTNCRS